MRRLVREGARMRVANPIVKEAANPIGQEVSNKSMSARSSSSSSAQTILSAKGEVGFKSVLLALPGLVLLVVLFENLPQNFSI